MCENLQDFIFFRAIDRGEKSNSVDCGLRLEPFYLLSQPADYLLLMDCRFEM